MNNDFGNIPGAVPPVSDSERAGFCQDCGRPLTRETVRMVGSALFCEPCLQVRLAAANTASTGPGVGTGAAWTTVPPVTPGATQAGAPASGFGAAPGSMPPGTFPPLGGENPSPALAALLGFIPGVGAIYNGQFAKGIAHIVIFALLSSLGHSSDFFSFLAFLWCCYQAYEAYHTAKARREGQPLPDPFGLNNIGERMGMGKGWPGGARNSTAGQPTSYPGWTGYVPPAPAANPYTTPVAAAEPRPVSAYQAYMDKWGTDAPEPYVEQTAPVPAVEASPAASWGTVPPTPEPVMTTSRFPAGAIWLIGLGLLFLVFNLEPDWRFSVNKIVPFFLMGLAVWIFVRRLSSTGGVAPREGEGAGYAARAVAGLRAPAVLFTVGILMGLQTFSHDKDVRIWRTWPVLLLVLGVVLLVERSVGVKAFLNQTSADSSANDTTNSVGKGY